MAIESQCFSFISMWRGHGSYDWPPALVIMRLRRRRTCPGCRQHLNFAVLRTISSIERSRSVAEDHAAETVERKRKIDAADHGNREKPRPDDGETSNAIENRLRERDEMRRRANDPHHILQPNRHALHRRSAA